MRLCSRTPRKRVSATMRMTSLTMLRP
jgi:hypothetical protein